MGMGAMYGPDMCASLPAVTELLGLTPLEIQAQLAQGNSLAEMAAAKGFTEDRLAQAILAQMKAGIDQYVTGGDADYARMYTTAPAWKDVIIVPKMGSVTLLVPVKDFTGMAMSHCHILEHEDIGMMGLWEIMDDVPGAVPSGSMGSGMNGVAGMSAMNGQNGTINPYYSGATGGIYISVTVPDS